MKMGNVQRPRGGRPPAQVQPEQVKQLRVQRLSWRQIAKVLGIGTATAMRLHKGTQEGGKPSQNSRKVAAQ